jgi:amino acid adenylation domain-containing protein
MPSALMEPMLARFEAVAREVKYASPRKTVISNVTGQPIGAELASWEYWSRHIMAEVRFYESIQSIGNPDQYVFLEIGPAPVLTGMVGDIYGPRADCVASTLPGRKTADQIERSLFQLYNRGVAVAWKKYYRGAGFTKITVPNYRFRERHFGLEELNEPTGSLASSGWIVANQTAPGAADHPSGMTVAHPDEVKKYLRAALVRELKLDQSELADEENLLLSGINSIITAKLAALCQKDFGITLDKGILLSNCTVNQWTELIYAKIKAADQAAEANIRFCPAPDRRYEPFLLNEVQSAYWAGRNSELEWGGVGCYEAVEIDWDGLDPVRFERALNALTQRHEMLRDIIDADGTQRILPELQPPLTVYRRESIRDLRAHLESVRAAMAAQVLPLGKPMFDIRLTELDAEKWRIHFGIDFMITDALSLDIFWQDLFRLYSGETLPALELSYKDYLTYMSKRKKSNRYGVDRQYWTGRAAGFPAAPDLPVNLTGKKLVQGRFVRRKKPIDSETWQGFVRAAAGRNLTPSAALLALYAEVLSAWGGGARFAVMLTAFAREPVHPQINRIIGDFTQLVLVAIHRENRPVAANAAAIQTQMQADLGHSNYSAVEFVKEINKKEAAAGRIYPVVFTSTLGMEALRPDTARSETFWDQLGWAVSSTPQVWLDHQVYQEKEGVSLVWDCWDALFQPDVVDAMFAAYTELVIRAAQAANFWSETLTDLRPASQRHSQAAANHTAREIPDTLLHEPLRYRAVTAPDTTAIVCANRQYSFRQLLARSDQVSELLQEQGVRPGDRVALQMSKSFEQIAVVLGILQVGAAYLPMAFDQPDGRAEEILRQAKVTVLCVDSQLELNDAAVKQLTPADWDGRQGVRREVEIRPSDLAYVIYTSGSTGIPKGVCISHRAAMNTVLEVNRRFAVAATDRILGLSALGFDLSVYDIFGLLSVGGTLVLPTETERLDPKCWRRLSLDQRVSIWNSVPALMDLYVDFLLNGANRDQDPGIRQVILSGDWIPLGLFAKLKQALPHARLTSMGGATEASIWSNYYEVTEIRPEWPSIPYGYPLANQSFHILDQFGRPCPDWVPGKLHIAGRGLADGYLNETELTNQAFFNHSIINERLYDTGDYGCYMGDGAILFHGRKDLQLKINGYRIESGEIEAALKKCGVGGDCVILPVGARMASKKLIAYIQGDPESFSEAELKARLHTYLPDYFIPERIIAAAALPLTANGKFDRKMLLEDFHSRTKTARPTTDGQIAANHPVLRAVREVLNLPELKPDDNLSDLGVSSVDLIKLANRLETVFSDRPAIGEMVKYQSLSELIAYYHHKNSGLAAKDGDQPLEEAAPLAGSAAYRGEAEKSGEALAAATSADWEAAANLVKRCHDRKIRLRLESGRLRFEAPRGAMTAALRAKLQTQKEQLIRYLHSNAVNAENGRPVTSGKTFPLSPMQMAYVLGRSPDYELGDTGAHYYVEFESNDLDPVKLEQAVNEVIRQHEMLRTVIYANGTQQVLEEIPYLKIPVDQISDGRQLEAIRDEWASHRYELGQWPMFHLRISRWDNRRSRLHFSYDCLIVDGWSAELMLREIFGAYYGRPVLKPEYTFREYLSNAARWLQEKNYHWEAANYWKERVKSLPPAPKLPWLRKFAAIGRPHFRRLQLMLAAEDYRRLGARLKQYHFTPAAALCTAYLKVLSCFSGNRAVTLNLTLFNRLPLHQDVPRLLGDFTNIALIAYQPRSGSTLAQELEAVQSQLWKAIEYRTYNGFNLLRELAREAPGRAVMPVVFTSLLSGDATTADLPADLKEVYATSQTPQVVLDHQVYGRNGALVLVWDFVVEAFAESVITAMFAAYCDLIGQMVAVADWAQVFTVAKDDQSSGSLG